jgi:hypothetical protein
MPPMSIDRLIVTALGVIAIVAVNAWFFIPKRRKVQ